MQFHMDFCVPAELADDADKDASEPEPDTKVSVDEPSLEEVRGDPRHQETQKRPRPMPTL